MKPAPFNRRIFARSAASLLAALAWPGAQGRSEPGIGASMGPLSGPLEKDRLTLAVGGKSAFYYLPLTIAEHLGFFRAQGLALDITDHIDADHAQQAALSGQADVVCGEFDHTLLLQTRKQYYQSFVQLARTPQLVLGVSTRSGVSYRTAADLRGKKIGLPANGASGSALANSLCNRVLERAGLSAADVSYVSLDNLQAVLLAFRQGQIDALCHTDPVMTMLEQRGDIRVICDTRTLKATLDWFGGPMPAACLYARLGFVQNHPNTCQALANGIVRSLKWLQTAGPSDLIKAVPESHLQGDRSAYLASFNKLREAISPDGVLPTEAAQTAWRVFASAADTGSAAPVVLPKIVLSRAYTNTYALRAKAYFKL
ncbi:MAG: ABC transporter substrate-binding protein [Burkholderiales bacterium]